jgi:hypothetical protein
MIPFSKQDEFYALLTPQERYHYFLQYLLLTFHNIAAGAYWYAVAALVEPELGRNLVILSFVLFCLVPVHGSIARSARRYSITDTALPAEPTGILKFQLQAFRRARVPLVLTIGYSLTCDLLDARHFLAEPQISLLWKALFVGGLLPACIVYAFLVQHLVAQTWSKRQ